MRKVLIPTDFSENAFNAIKYAMELFKYDKSEFIIMHAYADEVYEHNIKMSRALFEEYREKVAESSDRELQKVVCKMLEISPNPKHEYNFLSVFGSLVEEANAIADKENIDVLVMGTKGETADRDITYGSNTLQVIKYVKCPVLAIPSNYREVQVSKILFPTNYMLPYPRRGLKLVSTLAKRFAAKINLLYVSNFENLSFRQQDNKSFIECHFQEIKAIYERISGDDISEALNDFIEKNEIDMLVMVNTRYSYLENLLDTSAIQKIGLKIHIPFLVLQNLPR
jgi:nucleotide-binding universal stress UspA family protein